MIGLAFGYVTGQEAYLGLELVCCIKQFKTIEMIEFGFAFTQRRFHLSIVLRVSNIQVKVKANFSHCPNYL